MLCCCHAQPEKHTIHKQNIQKQVIPQKISHHPLKTGADNFIDKNHQLSIFNYQFSNIAVVANQSSLVGHHHLVDTLLASGITVAKIFCPEHGFRGTADAGATVKNSTDERTGLPIVSLYGKNKKPTKEQLTEIDAVIFDLQDVGCRFYTYISTLHYVMEACAEVGIPLIVLDRPNPNGHYVDGPVLDTSRYRSFIGMHPVPVVYGLTIGEYATMINGEHWLKGGIQCDLTIVPMQGYIRDSIGYEMPVPPSPNLKNAHSIALYPSLCLFEGTNVSVGRGTPYPFEIIGIPASMCTRACTPVYGACSYWSGNQKPNTGTCTSTNFYVAGQKAPGFHFTPKGGKQCFGIDLQNIEPPTKFDLSFLITMFNITKKGFFFLNTNGFEKLAGNDQLRKQFEEGLSEDEIRASWEPALSNYKEMRKKYLKYPDFEQR